MTADVTLHTSFVVDNASCPRLCSASQPDVTDVAQNIADDLLLVGHRVDFLAGVY
jgi:hypothetical protein